MPEDDICVYCEEKIVYPCFAVVEHKNDYGCICMKCMTKKFSDTVKKHMFKED